MYQANNTIAAIATAPGEGAVAIIRVSGPRSFEVVQKVYRGGEMSKFPSHTAHVGQIVDAQNRPIDQVLILVFRAPRSYTGEDTVEIQCHGGSFIAKRILQAVCQAGAKVALPGEFTFMAFYNQKLDLAQAEAVQLLVASKNELARSFAHGQLEGVLSKKIGAFQKELTHITAWLEACVDFPEEGLTFHSVQATLERLEKVLLNMQQLLATFDHGQAIHQGISLCLVGIPNVGKSSLMNALLGKNRAIVTDIPGTTRDLLESDLTLKGMHFRLIDTAGIRETENIVEKEGIRRSLSAMHQADVILLLLDASRSLVQEDRELLARVPKEKTIVVWNKTDVQSPQEVVVWETQVSLSAKEGVGLSGLFEAIERLFYQKGVPDKEEVVLVSLRHFQALSEASSALQRAIDALKREESPEFAAADMRSCLHYLSEILGTKVSEDILTSIFSQFCLGK